MDYRTYGADCRLLVPGQGINWPAIKGILLDEFVVAHTIGEAVGAGMAATCVLGNRAPIHSMEWMHTAHQLT